MSSSVTISIGAPTATGIDRAWLLRTCAAVLSIAVGSSYLAATFGIRHGLLFTVGVCAGIVLYQASFGFASAWRSLIVDRRGSGVRAQMLMLTVTSIVFFPLLSSGTLFGQTFRGSVSSVSTGVVIGAFLFGVGMQLSGGCASGALFATGGGSMSMLFTLAAFIAGAVIAASHLTWWEALPAAKPVSLVSQLGPILGLALTVALCASVAIATALVERRRHGGVTKISARRAGPSTGEWSLLAGALGLAAVNVLTLIFAGRPWGITGAFTLWGAKSLAAVGVDVESWRYFAAASRRAELHASVLHDVTSIMDFGIVLGAMLMASLAGQLSLRRPRSWRALATATSGGLLLGYGARIASGCNIGAFFSGISSGSLHGWLWFVSAFVGNVVGIRLKSGCRLPTS